MYNHYHQLRDKILIRITVLLLLNWVLLVASDALAVGNASFPQATTVSITVSGASTNFIISAGSDADSLTVNPSSFVFQISNGQRFTITSAQRFKFINNSSVATICESNNTSTLDVLGTTLTRTITVTPDGSTCTLLQTAGGGSGGGGGVVSNPASPTITPTPSVGVTPTVSATPVVVARVTVLPSPTPATLNPPPIVSYLFKRSLKFGSSGDDVKALQDFLRSTGFYSSSFSTGFFDSPTKNSVISWQKANGIKPATGMFGFLSISKYKKLTTSNITYSPAPIPKSKSLPGQVTVVGGIKYLNVRNKPSFSSKIVGTVRSGDVLRVTDSQSNWYMIEKDGKNLGWITKQYVTK